MVFLFINGKPLALGAKAIQNETVQHEAEEGQTSDSQMINFIAEPTQQKGFYLYKNTNEGKMYLTLEANENGKTSFGFKPRSNQTLLFTPRPPNMNYIQVMSSERVVIDFGNFHVIVCVSVPGKAGKIDSIALWVSGIIVLLGFAILVWKNPNLQKDINETEKGEKQQFNVQYNNEGTPAIIRGR
jgi:hypothetical protein